MSDSTTEPTNPRPSRLRRFSDVAERGGTAYATLFTMRYAFQTVVDWFDERLAGIEQRRRIVEPWAILARRLTTEQNRRMWNTHDWSQLGEEWTRSPEWKAAIVNEFLEPYFSQCARILEIGPGGGKWTEYLQRRAAQLVLVDVAEVPLELCRQRFREATNIEYHLGDGRSLPLPPRTVDGIWSFDCFVHVNPLDVKSYFREFARVLVPNGVACIHHAGPPMPGVASRPGNRSDMTDEMAREFAREAGLEVVLQTNRHVNPRDMVSILRRPA
jgi:SAM-dependent methyltransferase